MIDEGVKLIACNKKWMSSGKPRRWPTCKYKHLVQKTATNQQKKIYTRMSR